MANHPGVIPARALRRLIAVYVPANLHGMNLRENIERLRREIAASDVSMSLGELENLYSSGDLDIHPDYQRLFRWDRDQKSRLIESIMLGIPIPSFFVSSDDQGRWEVVDGLQRISTCFEFIGILKDESDSIRPALTLSATKNIPEFSGIKFSDFDRTLQRDFRRSRVDIKVLNRGSDEAAKYDLFERLNTYGSSLSSQEVRNCIIVSRSPETYTWLRNLARNVDFAEATVLSDSEILESYDMEVVMRFLFFRNRRTEQPLHGSLKESLKDFIDSIVTQSYPKEHEQSAFEEVFAYFNSYTNGSPFRAFRAGKHKGGFSLAAFEGLALSIGHYWEYIRERKEAFDLSQIVRDIWSTDAFSGSFSGKSTETRIAQLLPAGRRVVEKHIRAANIPLP